MTTYESPIILGKKYENQRTGVTGHAISVLFNENGCVEIDIERAIPVNGKIEVSVDSINELHLSPIDKITSDMAPHYESDIVLGRKYRDIQTGLEGWACVIEFSEKMATRVILRNTGTDNDGTKVLKHYSIDDFLLEDIETKKMAEPKTDKRSPITREVTRR